MKSDTEIADSTVLEEIDTIARKAGIPVENLFHYGPYIAKVPLKLIDDHKAKKSHLILVTAITATKAGVGKTTVSIGLGMGLNHIGKKAIIALREPSLGPCFGIKGGATGGGYAQVLPPERINLHFTGDFHAITSAHNLIAAQLDNYIFQNRAEGSGLKNILWRRVMDMNDRSLRQIVTGLGGLNNGIPTEANDLGITGTVLALLRDAIEPNLVQTTEYNPVLVHGGPFANIAHGCNSAIATRMALTFGDYVVTEAGFGADLGAEKFFNIKCRQSGLRPDLTVLLATTLSLKMHGGVPEADITKPNREGIVQGFANLDKHIENLQSFGQTVLVALNRFTSDTDEEIELIMRHCEQKGIRCVVNNAYTDGGIGAADLAHAVVEEIENNPSRPLRFTYNDNDSPTAKIEKIAHTIYGAGEVVFSQKAEKKLKQIKNWNLNHLPVCIAKTQYSFSADPKRYGLVKDFQFTINDIELNAGAGFIVAIAGEMLRMPGLPKHPQAHQIKVVNGKIEGLY